MKKINLFLSINLLVILAGCSTTIQIAGFPPKKTTKPRVDPNSYFVNVKNLEGRQSPHKCNYNPTSNKGGSFYKTDGPLSIPSGVDNILEPIPIFEPLHKWANRPYKRLGQDFVPILTTGTLTQNGIGTWYGRRYHGQKTSSGEVYDMFQMTAASPILPIPSYARVTNLKNGRSVVVRINDRGPFLKGRIVDLSFIAACKLDYATQGSTEVEVLSLSHGQ